MARYQGSIWRPTDKYGYGSIAAHTKGVTRVIIHSAEGYRAGLFAVLDGPRPASWHFSIMKNGEVYQHVSTAKIAWTAGSFEANDGSIQFEEEGVTGEALTPAQYTSTLKLLQWVFQGYKLGTPNRKTNLREHNEFYNTSCPSNRVPWTRLLADLAPVPVPVPEPDTKEDDMISDAEKNEILETLQELRTRARREEDVYVRVKGTKAVYRFDEVNQRLIHVVSLPNYVAQTATVEKDYPADASIWKLSVTFPAGLPSALK